MIGQKLTHPVLGSTALFVFGKLADSAPELLNCQTELLIDALEGRINSSMTPTVVALWTQASIVSEV